MTTLTPEILAEEIKSRLLVQRTVFVSGVRLKAAFALQRESFRLWNEKHQFGWRFQSVAAFNGYSFYRIGSEGQRLLES